MSEEQRIEAARERRVMKSLVETEGWRRMVEIAEKHVEVRKNEVLLTPTDHPGQDNYLKGEIQGITVLMKIPEAVIAQADAVIQLAKDQEENS